MRKQSEHIFSNEKLVNRVAYRKGFGTSSRGKPKARKHLKYFTIKIIYLLPPMERRVVSQGLGKTISRLE
jgi:hypothetical protein